LAFALYTLEIYILYVTLDLFRYAKINARNYAIIAVYTVIMTLLNYQCNSRFYKISQNYYHDGDSRGNYRPLNVFATPIVSILDTATYFENQIDKVECVKKECIKNWI